MATPTVRLDAETLLGFSGALLSGRYDETKVSPACHLEWWEMCTSKEKRVAIAAPRGHAKSTSITHAYVMACALFKLKRNIMILSDTQDQAAQFLGDIKVELTENEDLRQEFQVHSFIKERETELIVEMGNEGHVFRIFARGAGQSLRGSKWRGTRPDLVVCDDMENDELVVSPDRRKKLKSWFLSTLLPILSDSGQIRVVGTVLHLDSLLEWMLSSKAWTSRRYEAHNDDFTEILWPEKWSKERLLAERALYEEAGELEIYLQEYRNIPIDDSVAIFRQKDFLPIPRDARDEYGEYYISVDCAVSQKQRADYTVFQVTKVTKSGRLQVVDIERGRFDTLQTVDLVFELETRYKPQMFVFEDDNIAKSIGPFLYAEMEKRDKFPIIETIPSIKDLQMRVRSWVGRMRAGNVEFDTEAEWYANYHAELKQFPRGKHDDQVSTGAIIGMKLQSLIDAEEKQKVNEEEVLDDEYESDEDYYEDEDSYQPIYSSTGY